MNEICAYRPYAYVILWFNRENTYLLTYLLVLNTKDFSFNTQTTELVSVANK